MTTKTEENLHQLKHAIIDADLPGGSAVLALARLESDAEFRQALQAAYMRDAAEGVKCVVLAQFVPPDDYMYDVAHRREAFRVQWQREKARARDALPTPPLPVDEMLRLANEHTAVIAADLLNGPRLVTLVEQVLSALLREAILAALGLEYAFGSLRLSGREGAVLQKRLVTLVEEKLTATLEQLTAVADPVAFLTTDDQATEVTRSLNQAYQHEFRSMLDRRLRTWAEQKAKSDIENIFSGTGLHDH